MVNGVEMQLSQRSYGLVPCLLATASLLLACSGHRRETQRPSAAMVVERPPASLAPVSELGPPPSFHENLDAYIRSIGAGWGPAQRPTGFVAVRVGGITQFAKGYGLADVETARPHSIDTSYRIGSLTKGFTAAAVLKLENAGRLKTTDAIGAHLAQYPSVGRHITLHQLLRHTAGLPNYTNDRRVMLRRDRTVSPEELLTLFWDKPLDFEPGSSFSYSNSGYAVLGAVIEAVAKTSYGQHLESSLFRPLGLDNTVVGDATDSPLRAIGYTRGPEDSLRAAPEISMSVPFAAGGIRSTPADMLRWHEALGEDELLPESMRARMFEPGRGGYAYGFVVEERDGHTVASHSGAIDGFMSAFMRVPALDVAVVVLLNADTVPAEPIAEAALKMAMGQDVPPLVAEPPLPLTPEMIVLTEGRYALNQESVAMLRGRGMPDPRIQAVAQARIFKSGDTLKFKPTGQPAVRLVAVSRNRLRLLGASAELRVVEQRKAEAAEQGQSLEPDRAFDPIETPQPADSASAAASGPAQASPVAEEELSAREASWAPTAVGRGLLPVATTLELTQGPLTLRYERVEPATEAEKAASDAAAAKESRAERRRARRKARRAARLEARRARKEKAAREKQAAEEAAPKATP